MKFSGRTVQHVTVFFEYVHIFSGYYIRCTKVFVCVTLLSLLLNDRGKCSSFKHACLWCAMFCCVLSLIFGLYVVYIALFSSSSAFHNRQGRTLFLLTFVRALGAVKAAPWRVRWRNSLATRPVDRTARNVAEAFVHAEIVGHYLREH